MSFWDVILDFGLMSALILVGQLLRAKVKFTGTFYPSLTDSWNDRPHLRAVWFRNDPFFRRIWFLLWSADCTGICSSAIVSGEILRQ